MSEPKWPPPLMALVRELRERAFTRSSEREIATLEYCANRLEAALQAWASDAAIIGLEDGDWIIERVLGVEEHGQSQANS